MAEVLRLSGPVMASAPNPRVVRVNTGVSVPAATGTETPAQSPSFSSLGERMDGAARVAQQDPAGVPGNARPSAGLPTRQSAGSPVPPLPAPGGGPGSVAFAPSVSVVQISRASTATEIAAPASAPIVAPPTPFVIKRVSDLGGLPPGANPDSVVAQELALVRKKCANLEDMYRESQADVKRLEDRLTVRGHACWAHCRMVPPGLQTFPTCCVPTLAAASTPCPPSSVLLSRLNPTALSCCCRPPLRPPGADKVKDPRGSASRPAAQGLPGQGGRVDPGDRADEGEHTALGPVPGLLPTRGDGQAKGEDWPWSRPRLPLGVQRGRETRLPGWIPGPPLLPARGLLVWAQDGGVLLRPPTNHLPCPVRHRMRTSSCGCSSLS